MQYYRNIERTFPAQDSQRLRISNRSGELTIIGEDRQDITLAVQVSVDADSAREGDRLLDSLQIPITAAGGGVEVGPPEFEERRGAVVVLGLRIGSLSLGGSGTRLNMVARVPRTCAVTAEQRSGPLRVSGLRAGLRAESRNGPSEVAEVAGDVTLETRSGTTEVRRVEGDVSVEARSGRLEVESVTGHTRVRSRSGNVVIRDVGGELDVESRSGRVQMDDVRGPVLVRAHSGAVEFRGRIQHPVDIEVHSGLVKLAVTRDSRFFMDAETHVGSIRSELPVDYLERPPEDAPVVRVRTHAGAVRIVTA